MKSVTMNDNGEQERQIRRFLLGQLAEDERRRVEENLIVDAEFREHVLLTEETLIEDYLDGVLPKDEHEAFETRFGATTQLRRKVKIAKLLGTYGSPKLPDSDQSQPPTPPPRRWSYRLVIRNHPVVFTSIAAAMLLLIALGVLQGVRAWRESKERFESTRRILEIERELSQLNSSPVEASTHQLALAPVSPRDRNDASTLSLPFSAQVVELRLILTGNIHPTYTVELSKIGTTDKYHVDGLHPQATENGQAVVVRIPSRLLSRGDYRLSLIATAANGQKTHAGEYSFEVRS